MRESVWTNLFGEYFMQLGNGENVKSQNEDDDMLFYVRCNPRSPEQEVCKNIFTTSTEFIEFYIYKLFLIC